MKHTTDKFQTIVNLLGKIRPTDIKDPKGIADYAQLITKLVVRVGEAISQVEDKGLYMLLRTTRLRTHGNAFT